MIKEYVTYVHSINDVPFYVGSGKISRATDKESRSSEWHRIVENNKGQYDTEIILRGTRDQCLEIEQDLIDKYYDELCNKNVTAKSSVIEPKTESLYDIQKRIGTNIKLARKKRKITTSELAAKANINRTTLYSIEKGIGNPGMVAYLNIFYILGFHNDLAMIGENDKLGDMIIKNELLK